MLIRKFSKNQFYHPLVLNMFMEEALLSMQKILEPMSRRDLVVFADDMFVKTNQRAELEQIIAYLSTQESERKLKLIKKVLGTHQLQQYRYKWYHVCKQV